MYYYLFYKLYNFWEKASIPRFWSDAKAVITIVTLEIFIIYSLIFYYDSLINPKSHFGEGYKETVIMFLVVVVPNYLIFLHEDRWKEAIKEFGSWPADRNKRGGVITLIVVSTIVLHFFLVMFFL